MPPTPRARTRSEPRTPAPERPVVELDVPSEDARLARIEGLKVHLVGIGGCGTSGLALLLRDLGAACTGSDAVPSDVTRRLERLGIPVGPDDGTAAGLEDCDALVASAAVPADHPARLAALGRGIPVLDYAEALGLVQGRRTGISIAGTHGKSTTSAMLCHALVESGLDPGFIVGAHVPQLGGGSRCGATAVPHGPFAGRPGLLVAEACEFNRSFHHHRPVLGLINNLEEDHLDVYGSLDAIIEAFRGFAGLIAPASEGGRLLIAHEGAHRREVTAGCAAEVRTIGFSPAADYQVQCGAGGAGTVRLLEDGVERAAWPARMPGEHNALNAGAAAVLAAWSGAGWAEIARAMASFTGLDRRLQRLGVRRVPGGVVTVYDDYGHHPTEIDATLRALRASERPERLVCVFQPHQHSRTRFLLEEFARAFAAADVVIVPEIYFVRDSEAERQRIRAADLVDRLRDLGHVAMHVHPFAAIVEQLGVLARPGDLVVIMGAGPVWEIGRDFLAADPSAPAALTGGA